MKIEQMRDALTKEEIEHINSLSSKNLFHYVKDTIISQHTDKEIKGIWESSNEN